MQSRLRLARLLGRGAFVIVMRVTESKERTLVAPLPAV